MYFLLSKYGSEYSNLQLTKNPSNNYSQLFLKDLVVSSLYKFEAYITYFNIKYAALKKKEKIDPYVTKYVLFKYFWEKNKQSLEI